MKTFSEANEDSECLLEKSLDDSPEFQDTQYEWRKPPSLARQRILIFGLSVILVLSNTCWTLLKIFEQTDYGQNLIKAKLDYFGSPHMVSTGFYHDWNNLDRWEINGSRYKEEEWGTKMFPEHGGVVVLSKTYAKSLHLPESAPLDDDPDKSIYIVAGYHQLHCAAVLRRTIYQLNSTSGIPWHTDDFSWDHVLHCVEAVRQGLACCLDPLLLPAVGRFPPIPDGQQHVCRNRDALYKWSNQYGHDLPLADQMSR